MCNLFKPEKHVGLMEFVKVAKSCAEITPDELVAKLNARDNFLLVDVREPAECKHGRIGGAHLLAGGYVRREAEGKPQVREADY